MAAKIVTHKVLLTQDSKAVKSLIEFITCKPCKELPTIFALANGAQLTKSRNGDAYYTTTAQDSPTIAHASTLRLFRAALLWKHREPKPKPTRHDRESLERKPSRFPLRL
jgi:hypothetical protein